MRRRCLCLLLVLTAVLLLSLPVLAAGGEGEWEARPLGFTASVQEAIQRSESPLRQLVRPNCYVSDTAGILTPGQVDELEGQAGTLARTWQCGVYIVVVPNAGDYSSSITQLAEDIYLENGFGWGPDRDGVLLLMSMGSRKYDIAAYGPFGNRAFTDYGKEQLANKFLDNFKKDDWFGGFSDYLSKSGRILELARKGRPLDRFHDPDSRWKYAPMGLILGALTALVVCSILKSGMKNVHEAADAAQYVPGQGVAFTVRDDQFSHVTTTREKIERSSSGGSRGGGASRGSSGFSHRSGSF